MRVLLVEALSEILPPRPRHPEPHVNATTHAEIKQYSLIPTFTRRKQLLACFIFWRSIS
ncbi:hypothetical protein SPIROBIBN47_80004 [uncultured spirochete]|uniref:Uncharacterized protein n=1 Tax=uncultured spirochete TaxID=156406 RepID=A0A3P3XLV3_9SPIR|nr:hypothetical protein SPIROBIBN47_80004 [uncultured spirochete]